ncbi:MAG TPA: zinc ABC transporter substrate-binding protein, partial [Atopostipes sp.]|nr:zinc ABC transporter substrate-binding protein [Atopostipes sp.]
MSKKIKSIIKFLMPVFFLFLFLVGCGAFQDSSEEVEDERIQVVATTTMITDLVKVIGGNQVHVNGLMGPGIDPHGYRATASDVTDMGEADVVVYNGMHLEGQMGEVFSELENIDKDIFVLEEVIAEESMLDSGDESMPVDPH